MDSPKIVEIDYTNYKGSRRKRIILPERFDFRSGEPYHPGDQWLMIATDKEDGLLKTWAMKNIHSWRQLNG